MKDNGLLKYYKLQRIIGGRIDISSIATKFYKAKNEKFGQCIIDGKKFFIKDKYPTKRGDSAEILLSQIYANAGFDTALYFPAVLPSNNKNCLLCQDICDSKTLSPGLFDYPLTSNQRFYSKEFFDITN